MFVKDNLHSMFVKDNDIRMALQLSLGGFIKDQYLEIIYILMENSKRPPDVTQNDHKTQANTW